MSKRKPNPENKMGTQKISRLVLLMGIPLMLSLLINSLYNFVDSIFISRISEKALTALSLAAPVQLFMSALGFGNAVGLNAVISRILGEGKEHQVKKAANTSIFIGFCSWILIVVLCFLWIRPYFHWQAAGNRQIELYGIEYLGVCMIFSFGQMGQWIFDRFVIASGKANLFLFTLSAASLTNLILDPIFIFGLFGIPRLEALGAAIATVTGQIIGMVAGIFINRIWNKEIPFSFSLKPEKKYLAEILRIGIPSTFVQITTSVVGILLNTILLGFSTTAVAIYGICLKIHNVACVGVHGINNGLIPIVAYNLGAKKKRRINEAVKWALLYSTGFYLIVLLFLEGMPATILSIFDASSYMLEIGIPALRILALSYLVSILSLVISAALQGVSLAAKSMYLSISRQALFPIFFSLIFQFSGNLNLLWGGFILSEILAVPIALYLWKNPAQKVIETTAQI